MNVRNAANGVWVACMLAVALDPFKAHGVSSPAIGLPWNGGRDNLSHQKHFHSISLGSGSVHGSHFSFSSQKLG